MNMNNPLEELFEQNNIPALLEIMQNTENINDRNAIALYFSDIELNESVPLIISLIKKHKNSNQIGTLVYVLQQLNSKSYISEIVFLLNKDNYEAKAMLYQLIISKRGELTEDELMSLYTSIKSLKRFKGKKHLLSLLET